MSSLNNPKAVNWNTCSSWEHTMAIPPGEQEKACGDPVAVEMPKLYR